MSLNRLCCSTLVLALCLLPSGCMLPRQTIEGSDSSTLFAGLRSSWELSERPVAPEDDGYSRTLFNLEVSGSSSNFTQQVNSGFAVDIGSATFVGPTALDVEFDLLRITGDLRQSMRGKSGVGLEVFFGLGYSDLDLSGSSGGLSGQQGFSGWGPVLGLGVFYEPRDWLRFFAEGSVNPTLSSAADEFADLNRFDLGVSLAVHEHASLRAAWRNQTYEARSADVFTSDLDLTASGLALTLAFNW